MSQSTSSQLSRIKIEGFKSIKKCDLELRGINVLIGSNGSGKSNFISAFTLLQNILTGNLALYVGRSGLNSLFYNGIKTTDNILMEFYFDRNSYSFELVPTDSNGVVFKEERFGYHGRWNYTETTAGGHQESTWRDGNHNEIDKVVVPLVGAQEIIPVLNRQWRVYHFHDTGKNSKMKAEHNLSNNQALLPDASNLAAFLRRLRENYASAYRDVLEAVRLIAPYFQDFELEPNEGNGEHIVLRWRQRGCEDVFNASQLSDGTLRFICLATLLLQPAKLQPATIIVDEPELGLHPYAITIFAEMVKRASAEKQIILSTQSVELLNEFDVEDVVVVDRGGDGSEFKRLNAEELAVWIEND
ncbi:MAG: AAA family ATPase, partial [Oscillospiraceae bacterium]|nr:AAA family ATPase [Oscillospiraceae bacterium]